jgi:hypothetical protein
LPLEREGILRIKAEDRQRSCWADCQTVLTLDTLVGFVSYDRWKVRGKFQNFIGAIFDAGTALDAGFLVYNQL